MWPLPGHHRAHALRAQVDRTRALLATEPERGQQRLVEVNEPIELNLIRIIDGLERFAHAEDATDAA